MVLEGCVEVYQYIVEGVVVGEYVYWCLGVVIGCVEYQQLCIFVCYQLVLGGGVFDLYCVGQQFVYGVGDQLYWLFVGFVCIEFGFDGGGQLFCFVCQWFVLVVVEGYDFMCGVEEFDQFVVVQVYWFVGVYVVVGFQFQVFEVVQYVYVQLDVLVVYCQVVVEDVGQYEYCWFGGGGQVVVWGGVVLVFGGQVCG